MELSEIWIGIIIPVFIGPIFIYLKSLRDEYYEKKHTREKAVFDEKRDKYHFLLKQFYWPMYINLLFIYQFNYSIPIKNEYQYSFNEDESDNSSVNSLVNLSDNNISQNVKDNIISGQDYKLKNGDNTSLNSIKSDTSNNIEVSISIDIDNKDNINDGTSATGNGIGIVKELRKMDIILDKNTIKLLQKNLNKKYIEIESIIEENISLVGMNDTLNTEILKFLKYCKIRRIINEGSTEQEYNINYFGVQNNTNKLLGIIETNLFKNMDEYKKLISYSNI